jgi:hypothetical protein
MALETRYKTSEVARIEGISKRTIYEKVKNGDFPPPDEPAAHHGAPDFWFESTIRRHREERQARAAQRGEPAAA